MVVRSRDFLPHGSGSIHIPGWVVAQVKIDIVVVVIIVLGLLLVIIVVAILIGVISGLVFDMSFGLRRSWGRGFDWLLLLSRGRC